MKDLNGIVRDSLHSVAPEVDFSGLNRERPLRDQVELDSMDFLNFIARISKETGVRIPAAALHDLRSLREIEEYLRGSS